MQTFKDNDGRDWVVAVNVAANRRVRESLPGVDLFSVLDGTLVTRLEDDPELLVNVLYVLCREQAERAGISDVQFAERLVGDAITAATAALLGALVDFFPRAKRELIHKAVEKHNALWAAGAAAIHQRLDAIDPADAIRKAFGEPSTSGPGSPAPATPGR